MGSAALECSHCFVCVCVNFDLLVLSSLESRTTDLVCRCSHHAETLATWCFRVWGFRVERALGTGV